MDGWMDELYVYSRDFLAPKIAAHNGKYIWLVLSPPTAVLFIVDANRRHFFGKVHRYFPHRSNDSRAFTVRQCIWLHRYGSVHSTFELYTHGFVAFYFLGFSFLFVLLRDHLRKERKKKIELKNKSKNIRHALCNQDSPQILWLFKGKWWKRKQMKK